MEKKNSTDILYALLPTSNLRHLLVFITLDLEIKHLVWEPFQHKINKYLQITKHISDNDAHENLKVRPGDKGPESTSDAEKIENTRQKSNYEYAIFKHNFDFHPPPTPPTHPKT